MVVKDHFAFPAATSRCAAVAIPPPGGQRSPRDTRDDPIPLFRH
jgi:hypothetical protein